jgi:hypothetical protein
LWFYWVSGWRIFDEIIVYELKINERKRYLQWWVELERFAVWVSEELDRFGVWLSEWELERYGVLLRERKRNLCEKWFGVLLERWNMKDLWFFMFLFFIYFYENKDEREPIFWEIALSIFISRYKSFNKKKQTLRQLRKLSYKPP